MAKKDIYKIDNYFIRIGYILFFIGGLFTALDPGLWNEITIKTQSANQTNYAYEDKNGRTLDEIQREKGNNAIITERGFPIARSIMFVNGIVLLLIGYSYRSRENKIISVWNALEHSGQARVADLSISLGIPREFIVKHLKDINAQQQSAFTYDSRSDKIINNKLLSEFLVTADCVNCGNKINQTVSLDLSNPPRCQYCGTGIPADHLNKLKQEVLITMQVVPVKQSDFSIPIFVILLVVFWPGAVFYLIKKKTSS